ncbi:ribose-phosphate pyrophosphokinase [Polaromonas sp. OV174]|uniref:ribose-phosphate pyrophosphokinase n=1 Tax=Polaromonas sp. OV174 TaxID=1855300 RepID=UPI0008F3DAEC|nr:ribose-phosphate pyrophosphokinase [Polaromonas sp. OV174]SFC26088.1 ribose-phosphate pyrophosphokinase [Polaromonas sp. OV174]
MLIIALPGATQLASSLARLLRCDWSALWQHRFPDGETLVRIDAPVKGRCIVLAGSLHHPDDKTLPLLFAADAARDLGAAQVGLVAPYLAYMRQDHRFNAGEAITSRSYARLLSASLDFLVTVDPHLHRWHSLGAIYPIRTQAVAAAPLIARWLRSHVDLPLVIGPDQESQQWVAEVARLADVPWTVMSKTRVADRDVRVVLTGDGLWPGRTPVLLDDIISTGQTLVAATSTLKQAGMVAPLCIGVHALFDNGALQRLQDAGVARVVTCDTIPHASNTIRLAPLLARAVRAVSCPVTKGDPS